MMFVDPYKFRTLTSYTADLCTGGTASASSSLGAGNTAAEAFDDNAATLWASANPFANPQWVKYAHSAARTIRRYTIQMASVGGTDTQMPNAFTFQVWDGAAWQVLDTRTAQSGWSAGEKRTFDVAEHAYLATDYRINITAINGGAVAEIAEIEMMEGVFS